MSSVFGWSLVLASVFLMGLLGFSPVASTTIEVGGALNTGDTAWMLSASGLVLLMTPGLGLFYGGMVNPKNIISTILQSFIAIGIVTFLWTVAGFGFAFGKSINGLGLLGDPRSFLMFSGVGGAPHALLAPTIPFALFALFQLKFAIVTPALITGAVAERVRFSSLLIFMGLWSLFVYCPLAHWTWNAEGIFYKWGIKDFAGGTVVHISAGAAALASAMYLGKRRCVERGEREHPANIPLVILGTGLLWFGWFGFNAGSSLAANEVGAIAFLNTNTSSAVAMLTWIALDGLRGKRLSAIGACVAAVVGLVAITPAAGFVSVKASVFIGAIASVVSYFAVMCKSKFDLDDTLDVFACHGLGGIVGMIATAVFDLQGGLITGQTTLFIAHIKGLAITLPFCFVGTLIILKATDLVSPLRVSAKEEDQGLDMSQHGETALARMVKVAKKEAPLVERGPQIIQPRAEASLLEQKETQYEESSPPPMM
jgi:ammonium transporter, Amt family